MDSRLPSLPAPQAFEKRKARPGPLALLAYPVAQLQRVQGMPKHGGGVEGPDRSGQAFEAESVAQSLGRKLTFRELTTIVTVCRQNGDNDKAEVALCKAEKAAING